MQSPRLPRIIAFVAALPILSAAALAQETRPSSAGDDGPTDPRYGLLTPVPDRGNLPAIVEILHGQSPEALARRAAARGYVKQVRLLLRRQLRSRNPEIFEEGLVELREMTDPAAFQPMFEVLQRADDAVRLPMLDHFAALGDDGQAGLAWVAIHGLDPALRHEATTRMSRPAADPVLRVLDATLRSPTHFYAANAATLAGTLNVLESIPLLIAGQVARSTPPQQGDLAWIAVADQTVYVSELNAVVGDESGAFTPVLSTLTEGFVLRVVDAVVVVYRTAVNRALVAMTTRDWGQPTEHLGYDQSAWWDWYENEYAPFKNEQALRARMMREPE